MREFIDGVRPIENFTAKKFVTVSNTNKSRPKTAALSNQGMMYNQVARQNTMMQSTGEIYGGFYDARSPAPVAKKSTKAKKSILKKSNSRSKSGMGQS